MLNRKKNGSSAKSELLDEFCRRGDGDGGDSGFHEDIVCIVVWDVELVRRHGDGSADACGA